MEKYDCIACQHGEHSGHVEYPEKPPPGMMGGWHCPCIGDCATRHRDRGQAVRLIPGPVPDIDLPIPTEE